MTKRARRNHTPAFKAKVALAAIKGEIAGQTDEALILLDEALQIVEGTGERWFAAELNRNKGRLLLRQEHTNTAEELYRKALSIAEEQEAGSQALGIARRDEPRPPVRRTGSTQGTPRSSRPGLRMVHRRL